MKDLPEVHRPFELRAGVVRRTLEWRAAGGNVLIIDSPFAVGCGPLRHRILLTPGWAETALAEVAQMDECVWERSPAFEYLHPRGR